MNANHVIPEPREIQRAVLDAQDATPGAFKWQSKAEKANFTRRRMLTRGDVNPTGSVITLTGNISDFIPAEYFEEAWAHVMSTFEETPTVEDIEDLDWFLIAPSLDVIENAGSDDHWTWVLRHNVEKAILAHLPADEEVPEFVWEFEDGTPYEASVAQYMMTRALRELHSAEEDEN